MIEYLKLMGSTSDKAFHVAKALQESSLYSSSL